MISLIYHESLLVRRSAIGDPEFSFSIPYSHYCMKWYLVDSFLNGGSFFSDVSLANVTASLWFYESVLDYAFVLQWRKYLYQSKHLVQLFALNWVSLRVDSKGALLKYTWLRATFKIQHELIPNINYLSQMPLVDNTFSEVHQLLSRFIALYFSDTRWQKKNCLLF